MVSAAAEPPLSVVDRVAAELRERIKRGELVGGQRLFEAELTSDLGVSRGPVREALGRLASEGLVVVEANRGAFVRRLRAKDIVDLYEARAAIEGQAAALAARRAADCDQRELRELLRENEEFLRGGEFAPHLRVSERFHHLVLELADSAILDRLGRQLHVLAHHLQTTRIVRSTLSEPQLSVAATARWHHEIGTAVLRGDDDEAGRLMRAHLFETRDGFLALDGPKAGGQS
ncbi:GntR family transcriptional regulator [Amycolatopsis sp. GA6-003]|uniref:GntR family transcriptional regulator n=1 Tax=Amycolatopsis sp. GA6-003 TaxID=2652444 RepID=UPI003916D94F